MLHWVRLEYIAWVGGEAVSEYGCVFDADNVAGVGVLRGCGEHGFMWSLGAVSSR